MGSTLMSQPNNVCNVDRKTEKIDAWLAEVERHLTVSCASADSTLIMKRLPACRVQLIALLVLLTLNALNARGGSSDTEMSLLSA